MSILLVTVKKKQLLLFTFYPAKDYNLVTLKICLFLASFSLYMIINAFFFSDETMHNLHSNNGDYKIIAELPKIMYSSIISVIINLILKLLCLSQSNILELKNEIIQLRIEKKSKTIFNYLKIKFLIFFVISYLLLFFCFYYLSCFCAVYINTQLILIKDTLISFFVSMLYPIGLNLLPGIFRIPALKAPKKDNKLLYRISQFLTLI